MATNDTERTERWEARRRADETLSLDVTAVGVRADTVETRTVPGHPDRALVQVGGTRIRVQLLGTIAELRAVAVEIDRQLAHLEVEHRVDQATSDEGTGQ